MVESKNAYRVLVGKTEGRDLYLGQDAVGRIKSKMNLKEVDCGTGNWLTLRMGQMAGVCKSGNEPPGSLKVN